MQETLNKCSTNMIFLPN
uniref:Uncharacterized protein n=1 Tax=Anguilla anguilla TaxID=7936 RepID=A0A0E9VC63_ANGAN